MLRIHELMEVQRFSIDQAHHELDQWPTRHRKAFPLAHFYSSVVQSFAGSHW